MNSLQIPHSLEENQKNEKLSYINNILKEYNLSLQILLSSFCNGEEVNLSIEKEAFEAAIRAQHLPIVGADWKNNLCSRIEKDTADLKTRLERIISDTETVHNKGESIGKATIYSRRIARDMVELNNELSPQETLADERRVIVEEAAQALSNFCRCIIAAGSVASHKNSV